MGDSSKSGDNHPFDTSAPSLSRRAVDETSLLSGNYWGELRAFLCLAKSRSLSKAAEMLGSSHATVGREVRRLQDRMGSQLFVLSKAGAFLTERGEMLAAELLQLDQRLFSIESDLKSETSEAEGLVRVAITDGLGAIFLVPQLRRLAKDYPKIQVHVKTPGNLRNLRENQTDIMLGFADSDSGELSSRRLGILHFIPIASSDYIDRMGLPTRKNLAEHVFVDSELYSAREGPFEPWHRLKTQGSVTYACDASISYGMMVKAGLGIGLLSNYNMMEPSARPLDLGVHIRLPLYAVALTERLNAKPVKLVFDMVQEIFSTENSWFSEQIHLDARDEAHKEGYKLLFNL